MDVWKKSELLKEKAVSFTLGVMMLKPSRSIPAISSTLAERPPPEPPPPVVVNIWTGPLLLRLPSTLQKTEFGFSSLELGTERPPRKPPWGIFGWVCLVLFEFSSAFCVFVVGLVCFLLLFCVLCVYLKAAFPFVFVCFESLSKLNLNCWYHTSFIGLYGNESSFITFALHQLIFVQNDKVKKSETKCSRNGRDVVEEMIRNWIGKKTLDSHISFVRHRRWKLLMDGLLGSVIWLKFSYLSPKFMCFSNHILALLSPAKLVEQAMTMLEDDLGFCTENSTQDVGNHVFDSQEDGELPRKRRPGLGLDRARPRFSLKPTKKPSVEDLLPILDLKKLKDPEEFFMAHERLENAKREIENQLGIVSSQPSQDSTKPRERRPGIPGFNRRPVRYRHRVSTEALDNNDVLSSQEAFESDSLDPVGDNTDKGKVSLASLDTEVTDSPAIEENKMNDILKGLLDCDSEELEGEGAMNLLQERLQVKSIVLEKLSVPDFLDTQPIDLKSFQGTLSKPSKRKAFSDVDNWLKGMNIQTPLRRSVGCAEKQLASPTPPKSPFASLSSLQKHISRSKLSTDPFSAHEIDHVPTRNYSPIHMANQEADIVGSSKPSDELTPPVIEDVIAAGDTNTILETSENSKEHNSRNPSDEVNAPIIEDIVDNPDRNCTITPQKSMVDNSTEPGFNANVDSNEPAVDMDVDIGRSGMGKRVMDDTVGRQNVEPNEPYHFDDNMLEENMQEFTTYIPTDDANLNSEIPLADQSNPVAYQANSMDKRSTRSDDGPEQCLQEKAVGSAAPINGQKRVKSCTRKGSKGKRLLRKSLADAGTSWESGVRRSTRFRTKPLEYWKGERMVYGRVHESLSTVIGVKCMSTGSDGKPTMKAKSFVSDKYKDLFEIASEY